MLTKFQARTVLGIIGVSGFILLTASFVFMIFFMKGASLPEGDLGKQIIGMFGMVVGIWNSAFSMIMSFHFGSSQGSKDKEDAQSALLKEITSK